MDFAFLPPEINSGRMYTGPGAGPMLASAAAWDDLAAELSSTAASYASTVSSLTGGAWQGPSSQSMAAQAGSSGASDIGTEITQFINSLPTALQNLANGLLQSPTTGSTNLLSGLSLPQLTSLTLPPGLQTDLTNWNTIWSALTGPYSL